MGAYVALQRGEPRAQECTNGAIARSSCQGHGGPDCQDERRHPRVQQGHQRIQDDAKNLAQRLADLEKLANRTGKAWQQIAAATSTMAQSMLLASKPSSMRSSGVASNQQLEIGAKASRRARARRSPAGRTKARLGDPVGARISRRRGIAGPTVGGPRLTWRGWCPRFGESILVSAVAHRPGEQ